MESSCQIRFVDGAGTQRAAHFSGELWEKHKPELWKLRNDRRTLDDIIDIMKKKHDFAPSRRQLGYHFAKWKTAGSHSAPEAGGGEFVVDAPQAAINRTPNDGDRRCFGVDVQPPPAKRHKATATSVFASTALPTAVTTTVAAEPEEKRSSAAYVATPKTETVTYENLLPSTLASVGPLARSALQMDQNKHVISFSEDEVARVKLAAQLFLSCRFHDEAFRLCALLIERDRAASPEHHLRPCHGVFVAAHTAILGQDGATPQTLLRLEQIKAVKAKSALHEFLSVMLLADCKVFTWRRPYGSEQSDGNAEHFVRWAGMPASKLGDLLDKLPQHDRSLDLLTWYQLVRLQASPGPKLLDLRHDPSSSNYGFGRLSTEQRWAPWAVHEYTDALLLRRPGPFELADGVMQNSCLRQCVESCHSEILKFDTILAIVGIWEKMGWKTMALRNVNMARPSRVRCSIATSMAMFVYLWGIWVDIRRSQPRQMAWIDHAEARMGIPPTELLVMVCHMICDAAVLWKPVESHPLSPLLLDKSLRSGVGRLAQESDENLARRFLGCFHQRNSLVPWPDSAGSAPRVPSSIVWVLLRKTLGLSGTDPGSHISLSGAPAFVRACLDVPPLGSQCSIDTTSMAPSLSSSDYSAFSRLRDRISRAIRPSSVSVVSQQTIISISDSLDKYLNISPMRTEEDVSAATRTGGVADEGDEHHPAHQEQ
ncbi:hypothetical protein MFIFM68171_05903 [Madurella fahalii]|uniref:Clr5 domain-containing protein n=1 Tax=Madurella fahalii TaxID=1157608 RepID=A0ABQ0GD43_9PEZI